jgi:hypothetical protein
MYYFQILKDSYRIFRSSKLILVFGLLSTLMSLELPFLNYIRSSIILSCLFFLFFFASFYITLVSEGGLIFLIHRVSQNENTTFPEVWHQGRLKVLPVLGLILLVTLPVFVWILLWRIIANLAPHSLLPWLSAIIQNILLTSFSVFGLCAIIINGISILNAAWTSILITFNNLLRVSIMVGIIFVVRLFFTGLVVVLIVSGLFPTKLPVILNLDYSTYLKLQEIPVIAWTNWIVNIFLAPFLITMLTLGYLKFTQDISYPALVKKETTA